MKTAVSLPTAMFAAIDALAAERGSSRTSVVVAAIDEYLRRIEDGDITRSLNEAYAEELSSDELAWIDDTLRRQMTRLDQEDGGWPADA
ncbi:MAG: ribbon-helix-helix protein, CopG family [Tepidiformaceae bacterium]